MTSDSMSSAANVSFAVHGIRQSPHRVDAAATVLARGPQAPQQPPAQQPVRRGDDAGYGVDRGPSERGSIINIRV